MPDTKSGRERKGRNKAAQLREALYERELTSFEDDDDLVFLEDAGDSGEFIASELPDD